MLEAAEHTLPADDGPERSESGSATSLALDRTLSRGPVRYAELHRGALIDRYVVLNMAGAGAMGVVLVAYDPKLDRKLAIKLLKVEGGAAQLRLEREARALAKLGHPNVVSVFDVGTHADRLFIAMEYVDGETLGGWMAKLPAARPWRRILEMFAGAGRGLAAAHAAGLVHRDFKPHNVMLGHDGRARVMDFGLARTVDEDESEGEDESEDESEDAGAEPRATSAAPELGATSSNASKESARTNELRRSLTQTGALMGTPAYMSPEQFEGKPADARSDQFGFCIALYEALYGERPFPDANLAELLESLPAGRFKPPPPGATVPAWVRKVVLRGLAPNPDDRWPSMMALLDALADNPAVRRRKWIAAGIGVGALAAAALMGMSAASSSAPEVCDGFDAELAGVWDTRRRGEIESAMLATKQSYASGTWARVESRIDAWTEAWIEARVSACAATRRGAASAELLDLRAACLDEQLTHLRAVVDVLAEADAVAVEKAADAVDHLPQVSACADVRALLADQPERDPELAEAVAALERRMIAAEAVAALGKPNEALAQLEQIAAAAEPLDDARLDVDVGLSLGWLQREAGQFEAARTTLRAAYRAAVAAGLDARAMTAASRLITTVGSGTGLARPDEGRDWAFHAGALVEAAGTEADRTLYLRRLGEIELLAGDYAEARAHFEAVLARCQAVDPEHGDVTAALTHLANLASLEGKVDESIQLYQRALVQLERTRDPSHPHVALMHLSMGEVLSQAGRYAEAREQLETAARLYERAYGPSHVRLGSTLATLGYTCAWLGEYADGRAALERGAQILAATVGTQHYAYADLSNKRGVLEFLSGNYDAATEHYERASVGFVAQLGANHPNIGVVLVNLAEVAHAEGRHALALERVDGALAILEPSWGADSPDLLLGLDIRGAALVALGRPAEAEATLERTRAIRSPAGEPR